MTTDEYGWVREEGGPDSKWQRRETRARLDGDGNWLIEQRILLKPKIEHVAISIHVGETVQVEIVGSPCDAAGAIFEGGFGDLDDLYSQWEGSKEELAGARLIYASYDCPDYEGSAEAIWLKGGKLYEAHASHCSCNGLEGFDAEETTLQALLMQQCFSTSPKLVEKLAREFAAFAEDRR